LRLNSMILGQKEHRFISKKCISKKCFNKENTTLKKPILRKKFVGIGYDY